MSIEAILRRQAGVISRKQARASGLSADQLHRQIAAGRWARVHPGVYLPTDRELTGEARVWAAWLWAGDPAIVSGLAAAWWHRLWPDPPSIVDITVPPHRCPRPRPGIRLRRRELDAGDRVGIRGLWVTNVPLTVLEAAAALGDDGLELMDRALQRRVHLDTLHRAHSRNLGRRGSTTAGRLLKAAADRAGSAAERTLHAILRDARLTGWVIHYHLAGYEIDLAFPEQRVAIEIDGWVWHHDVKAFQRDRQRQNAIVLAGWTILRFTWHDLTVRPGEVIAHIRAALASRMGA